ncbi:transcription factor bHLH18-like isoform X2 [Cynara cardunculus var. scolymus]|uniref:transcription factor bHLH18-like isoform X2 n=1 Tax=Cynara cardunculus var. scolymus TaxID=59895 RepID=UPI000D62F2C3|nr:transcription factor bHLH18-like isoform X2 [Cynara cardunculus var. scolymus]
MDIPSMEMEEPSRSMKQHQQPCPYYSDSVDSFSSERFKGYPNMVTVNQSIQVSSINGDQDKQQDYRPTKSSPFSPSYGSLSNTFTISFGDPTSPQETNPYQFYRGSKLKYLDAVTPKEEKNLNDFLGSVEVTGRVRSTRRNHRQAQEHVLAERKRREKLAQRFISLSALLPGLKKMDKASVLEDASKYIVQLQTRVKELQETSVKGKDIIHESVVPIRRSKFSGRHEDNGASSSNDTNYLPSSSTYNPEIKARTSGSKILVRIFCGRSSALVLKTLAEMQRLHITIICCSVLPFSNTTQLITITAQMSDEMVITRKYIVKCLKLALSKFP